MYEAFFKFYSCNEDIKPSAAFSCRHIKYKIHAPACTKTRHFYFLGRGHSLRRSLTHLPTRKSGYGPVRRICWKVGFEPGVKEWGREGWWEWWWRQRWADRWMRRWVEMLNGTFCYYLYGYLWLHSGWDRVATSTGIMRYGMEAATLWISVTRSLKMGRICWKVGFEPGVKEWWMMRVVMMTEMSWQVNEEVSRDMYWNQIFRVDHRCQVLPPGELCWSTHTCADTAWFLPCDAYA